MIRNYRIGISIKRFYSDSLKQIYDYQWPVKISNPTPYDIFNLEKKKQSIDLGDLKKKYHEYIKMYHPDQGFDILTNKDKILNEEEKKKRILMIIRSYKILKTPKLKRTYDISGIGWINNEEDILKDQRMSDIPYEYWQAGTWEDIQKTKEFSEEKENEKKHLGTSIFAGLIFCGISIKVLTVLKDLIIEKFGRERERLEYRESLD
ncbi:hypothetical protein TBLA_0A06620 [Henningerozyma blattae CBS 6284]|uniref:J domain-containing protein n=1 Tax=Henningerozyma blattae (strain ATCC 34711 / CBS 6284 / DSM 70876 / NBRC 10599 / NRRL Y-10934 / UCD 77-7) TaxID=1071380 RepID=I2GWF2_HENB6|nr:hypothetical protein TBLA_0A06620 [Tetrapisispora blattae CBS 6284]CCH58454.1 hypothetical protein TBLA_0A06620 [Tetrapisispora blattae CBS 6284]